VTEQERIVTEQERSLAISTRSRPHAVRKTQSVCAVVPSPRGGVGELSLPQKSTNPTPNWNSTHYKLWEFLSSCQYQAPWHKLKAPHMNMKCA